MEPVHPAAAGRFAWDPLGEEVRGIAFQPGGRLLASGGSEGNLYLWDVGTHPHRLGTMKSIEVAAVRRVLASRLVTSGFALTLAKRLS